MDRKLSKTEQKERLIRLSAASRSCLEGEAALLKQKLDVPARVRSSLKTHPTGWLLGSLAAGLAASLVFRRKRVVVEKVEKKRHSFPLTLLGLTLTAVRPLAKVWLTDQVKHYMTGQRVRPTDGQTYPGQTHF